MQTLTLSEFRANVAATLDRVQRGQTVRILRHGKPVADLVPVKPEAKARTDLPSWKLPFEPVVTVPAGHSTVKLLLVERERAPW